jgi:S-adenosylmethionine-diacylglycerol 3-amino-3-carboxypropyl transferase
MDSSIWRAGNLGKSGARPKVVFAQVREDAAIELEVLQTLPADETAFCIASGGCTALTLLLARPQKLHVVDVNPAQIFMVDLKCAALANIPYSQMLRSMTRDARPIYAFLRPHLGVATQEFWKENLALLSHGFNGCGLIDIRLRQMMRLLPLVQSRRNVRRLFTSKSLREQRDIYEKVWNHSRWKLAFRILLSRCALKMVYGKAFVDAVPSHFAEQMKQRVDEAFTQHLLSDNPYLWQTFRSTYPQKQSGLPLYLQKENHVIVKEELSKMQVGIADAAIYLEAQKPHSIGFFALSNILEITSDSYSRRLMRAVFRAAKPEAKICMRSIFPFNENRMQQAVADVKAHFDWLPASDFERRDRSFFCKNIRVLRVLSP